MVNKVGEDGENQIEEVKLTKNTNERALIYITVPKVEVEEEVQEEVMEEGDDGPKEVTKIVKKMVDVNQKEKALCVQGRDVGGGLGNFWVIT